MDIFQTMKWFYNPDSKRPQADLKNGLLAPRLYWYSFLFTLCVLHLLLLGPVVWAQGAGKQENISRLLTLEGHAELATGGNEAWKEISPGQVLAVGDRLKMGDHSRGTVLLSDSSVIRVSENTILHILPPPDSTRK